MDYLTYIFLQFWKNIYHIIHNSFNVNIKICCGDKHEVVTDFSQMLISLYFSTRVTWLASDSVADYMRRIVQDKKPQDIPPSNSETSNLPKWNSLSLSRVDSKGRRLSYQRAVSGEDPVRYQEAKRKSKLFELNEVS